MMRGGGNSLIAWPRIGFARERLAICPFSQNKACHPAGFDQELASAAQAELSPEFGRDSVRQEQTAG